MLVENEKLISQVEKIKKHLSKKMLDPVRQAGKIFIKDIIISASTRSLGEFKNNGNSNLSNLQFNKNESDDELINRLLLQITDLANLAKRIHFQDNFDSPEIFLPDHLLLSDSQNGNEYNSFELIDFGHSGTIKPDRHNHITRLTTNEFLYYPFALRGPLDVQTFQKFLEMLFVLAKELPENLHLILSSFPVYYHETNTENVILHIQCGKTPIITPVTKAIPAPDDPNYIQEELSHHYHPINKIAKMLLDNLKEKITAVKHTLSTNSSDVKLEEDVSALLNLCMQYDILKPHAAFIECFNELLSFIQNKALHKIDLQKIICQLNAESETYQDFLKQHTHEENKNLLANPKFSISKNNIVHQYTSPIKCKTYGGLIFSTIIEICLDHYYRIGLESLKREFRISAFNASEVVPEYISHVLTSNSINAYNDATIAANGFLTHADQKYPNIFGKNINTTCHKNKHSAFGPPNDILISNSLPLQQIKDHLWIEINQHNDFVIKMMALTLLRTNENKNNPVITKLIDKTIHQNLLANLEILSLGASPALTNLFDEITIFFTSENKSRSEFIQFLTNCHHSLLTIKHHENFKDLFTYYIEQSIQLLKNDEIYLVTLEQNKNFLLSIYLKNNNSIWQKKTSTENKNASQQEKTHHLVLN